jgi:hypothetical protein
LDHLSSVFPFLLARPVGVLHTAGKVAASGDACQIFDIGKLRVAANGHYALGGPLRRAFDEMHADAHPGTAQIIGARRLKHACAQSSGRAPFRPVHRQMRQRQIAQLQRE